MKKNNSAVPYLLAGLTAALFVVLVVWLVRSEGERTRETLREAADSAAGEVREGLVDAAEQAVDRAAEVPGDLIRDVKDGLSDEATETAERAVDTLGDLAGAVLGNRDEKQPDESPTAAERTVEEIEEYFRSHPPTQERVKRLETLLGRPAPR